MMLSVRTIRRNASGARFLSSIAFTNPEPDFQVFPREAPGLNYDLNWSLADDNVTPSGDAYRNPSLKELMMFATGKVAGGSIDCAGAAAKSVLRLSTDEAPESEVMDIDLYEDKFEEVTGALSTAERLFVQDAAVGSTRDSEVRLRVISDAPEYSLAMRALLPRIPVYHPEAHPRPLKVYISTQSTGPAFVVVDYDPEIASASVVVSGAAPLALVRDQIAFAAGQLMHNGGYRHVRGGGPRVQAARDDGNIEWYMDDRYRVASPEDAHPDLLRVRANTLVDNDGGVTLVVGDVAPSKGQELFAAHDAVWTADGVSRLWDGVTTASRHGQDSLAKGSVTFHGETTSSLPAIANSVAHPSTIRFKGKASDLGAALGLTEEQSEKLRGRIDAHGVKVTA